MNMCCLLALGLSTERLCEFKLRYLESALYNYFLRYIMIISI